MGIVSDYDPTETQEWVDSLRAVLQYAGPERASYLLGKVRDEAQRMLDERKGRAASQLQTMSGTAGRVAHALRAVKADAVADYADTTGDALDRVAKLVESAELSDLTERAGDFARRHPAWVIGGVFAAGFVAARVLKAGSDEDDQGEARPSEGPQRVRVRRRPRR